MTRVLIIGSRAFNSVHTARRAIREVIAEFGTDVTIVHGDARGADRLCAQIGAYWGLKTEAHPADWSQGKRAGFIRNQEMVDLGADLALAFLVAGEPCRGTRHAASRAEAAKIPVRWYTQGGA